MANQTYIPTRDNDKVTWINNFALKKEEHATTFGFSPASVTMTKKDAAMFTNCVRVLYNIRTDSREFTAFKDLLRDGKPGGAPVAYPTQSLLPPIPSLVPAGIFSRVSADVITIKNSPKYTSAIGQEFGIITTPRNLNTATYITVLKLRALPGYVEVRFTKKGVKGISIYKRLQGQRTWNKLGIAITSPFEDHTALQKPGVPEKREYMARGLKGNNEIGQNSAVHVITFGG